MITAWIWFGAAFFEEMTEQCKSLIAGTTEAGLGATLGIPPVVLAHLLGLIILVILGIRGRSNRWTAIVAAIAAVAVASGIGVIAAELLWTGQLFTMGAAAAQCG